MLPKDSNANEHQKLRKIGTIKTIKEEDENSEMTDGDNQEDLPVIDNEIDKIPSFIGIDSEFGGEESKRE